MYISPFRFRFMNRGSRTSRFFVPFKAGAFFFIA